MSLIGQILGQRPSGDVYWHYFQAWRLDNGAWSPFAMVGGADGAQYVNSAQAKTIRDQRRVALSGPGSVVPVADEDYVFQNGSWELVNQWQRIPAPVAGGRGFERVTKGK